ncbi:transposase [Streptomyces cyaneochromogenes]|uniref:transposase n=1 Tax=Streptomyces cyaneochromogenes TaxID=2496836 RepID=UPI001E3B3836|nr:transposase [Streptomyces cyaneochromogenes]
MRPITGTSSAVSLGLTDTGWAVVRLLLPVPGPLRVGGGQPEAYCHRAMLDAVGFVVVPKRWIVERLSPT